MKTKRNDPCPCGSGKKYKKCCLGKQNVKPGPESLQNTLDEVREKIEGGEFSSLEEVQAELNQLMQTKNTAPLAEFHGLSSEQMHRILHFSFNSPELVKFSGTIDPPLEVPALKLFSLLAEAIGDKGLKPTAKGNLSRHFCQEAALSFWGEEKYAERTRYGSIRSEMDFFDMHCLRLVAGLAGLVRKYKGKFILSVKCRKIIAAQGIGGIYPNLFKAYVQKFNWAYTYGYQEIYFIQQSFLFTLYLLKKYGDKLRPQSFYEDIFLAAFPDLLHEIKEVSYQSVEETISSIYFCRTFEHFANFFGLAKLQKIPGSEFPKRYKVQKSHLLDHFISFTLQDRI